MPTGEEQDHIARARDGDLDAFNRLVESYQDSVFGVALRMVRNRAAAEDITQEAFISAWRAIKSYRGAPLNPGEGPGPKHTFRAWLLRIARNATYDHLRRAGRRAEVSIDDDAVTLAETAASQERGPEEWALAGELGKAISNGLGTLPEDQRMAVVLVDIEGHSYEEAAIAMDTNTGTVKSRLNRARAKLRDFLRRTPELLPAHLRQEDEGQRAHPRAGRPDAEDD